MDLPRQRLRFEGLSHETAPDGRCRITVRMEWCGKITEASAEGLETLHGRVRAAADASLEATLAAAGKRLHLDLVGVKAVRAFDGWIVVVRILGEAAGRNVKLLGSASCEQEDGLERAAALAVLDATNRHLSKNAPA